MPINPNIAMSFRGVEMPQQNALADYAAIQQIQGGQRQAEVAQMQMQRMRQTDAALEQVRQAAIKNGGPGDLNEIANAYLSAPDREMQQFGIGLMQKLQERAQFTEFGKKNYPELFGGGATAAAPAAAPVNAMTPAAAPVNAMAPAVAPVAAPVNAMAPAAAQQLSPPGKTRQQLEGLIYMAQGNPLYKGMAETAKLELNEMMKPPVYHTVPGVGLVDPRTGRVVTAAAAPTTLSRLQTELAALPPGDPRRADYMALIRKETTHAPATSVYVSTEKKYGEAFGGKMAESDIGKLTTAEKAPQLADSANRIIDIVKQGNVFVGPAADIKLNIARALNVAGTDNQQKIANTESLIAASGQSTLDAIKSAGLGTGQGFTDKDLKFLQGIAGGTINLTAQTLTELATLQHRAASRSAESWNKRVQEMPKEVLQGTGLSTAPIKVAPLTGGKPAGPSVGAIQDGYRFKGGNPAVPASWEKM